MSHYRCYETRETKDERKEKKCPLFKRLKKKVFCSINKINPKTKRVFRGRGFYYL